MFYPIVGVFLIAKFSPYSEAFTLPAAMGLMLFLMGLRTVHWSFLLVLLVSSYLFWVLSFLAEPTPPLRHAGEDISYVRMLQEMREKNKKQQELQEICRKHVFLHVFVPHSLVQVRLVDTPKFSRLH